MSARILFAPGERSAIDAAHERAREAISSTGIGLPSRGKVHADFHRWLIRRARSSGSGRPRHAESAAILLEWSRDKGDVSLYALAPLALATYERHGESGLRSAAEAAPGLGNAWALLAGLAPPSRLEGARAEA